jgi:hypothetical protein
MIEVLSCVLLNRDGAPRLRRLEMELNACDWTQRGIASVHYRQASKVFGSGLSATSAFTCQTAPTCLQADTRSTLDEAQQESHQSHDDEDDKQYLGNADSAGGNAAKTEQCGNERDHEKYDSVVKHHILLE